MIGISDLSGSKGRITLGADPEVFLKNLNGEYVSAIGKFKGTKNNPDPVTKLGKGFAVQVDNVLLEYNIPPANSAARWRDSHVKMLDHLSKLVAERDLVVSIDAAAEMPDSELADPLAKVFGCDPDFNAWELTINEPPRSPNAALRSAGGHIHIGGAHFTDMQKVGIVRWMDMLVGAWATLKDPDLKRKELYGRPGAMRFKDYGLEYRTVSNFWLKTQVNMNIAYNLTCKAVKFAESSSHNTENYRNQVLSMFNNNDKKLAASLLEEFGISLKDYGDA